jgi:hypothetical protein
MPPLRIIYTPSADRFRINGVSACFPKYKGDPETNAMRKEYSELRKTLPDLPAVVGVATLDKVMKQYALEMRREVEEGGAEPVTTTYFPLDIMDAAIKLKDEDVSQPLAAHYVYRTLSVLFSYRGMIANKDVPGWVNNALLLGTCIANMDQCAHTIQNIVDTLGGIERGEALGALESGLKRTADRMFEMTDWGKIERAHGWFYERFMANRVSRGIPLIFMKTWLHRVEIASVSLDDRLEERTLPDGWGEGARKHSASETDADRMIEKLRGPAKDLFGQTVRVVEMDKLLESLPEPKTLITDLYIVDHFPDLAKIGFEPIEYIPPDRAASD